MTRGNVIWWLGIANVMITLGVDMIYGFGTAGLVIRGWLILFQFTLLITQLILAWPIIRRTWK